jgi:hypothetical protein
MKADPKCKYCKGTGTVVDWVDYGSTRVSMSSQCDCAVEECPKCKSGDTYLDYIDPFTNAEQWRCNDCELHFIVEV